MNFGAWLSLAVLMAFNILLGWVLHEWHMERKGEGEATQGAGTGRNLSRDACCLQVLKDAAAARHSKPVDSEVATTGDSDE